MPILLGIEAVAAAAMARAALRGTVVGDTLDTIGGYIFGDATEEGEDAAADAADDTVTEEVPAEASASCATTSGAHLAAPSTAPSAAPAAAAAAAATSAASAAAASARLSSMHDRSVCLPRLFVPDTVERTMLDQPELLEQLSNALPRRYGDTGAKWHLHFSTSEQGTSLAHMLRGASGAGPCLLLLRDVEKRIIGAYLSELREPGSPLDVKVRETGMRATRFYGNGESLLFAVGRLALPPLPNGSTPEARRRAWSTPPNQPDADRVADGVPPAHSLRTDADHGSPPQMPPQMPPQRLALFSFPWTKANDLFIRSDSTSLVIGGGKHHGLFIDDAIRFGSTGRSDTFGNPPLSSLAAGSEPIGDVEEFECEACELWAVDEVACRSRRAANVKYVAHANR